MPDPMPDPIPAAPFGRLADGRPATCFTLQNPHIRVRITDYGARLAAIQTPDRHGVWDDILLGFEDAAAYEKAGGSFGAILGRYANRIAQGRFTLDGTPHQLARNDSGNTLHGGPQGFGEQIWSVTQASATGLTLTLTSPDGDQGFPGTLIVQASYRLSGPALHLALTAQTDQPTIINLSSHPYFNLGGAAAADCLAHEICIAAERFLLTDAAQIPTGAFGNVQGTAFDFRTPKRLDADLRRADPQLLIGKGYDHCFVTAAESPAPAHFAASAYHPPSGRLLQLRSTQPGLQFYSGNMLNGAFTGRGGIIYRQSAGFAFEAQNFPDAPNHPGFPAAILRPGETYHSHIIYSFTTR